MQTSTAIVIAGALVACAIVGIEVYERFELRQAEIAALEAERERDEANRQSAEARRKIEDN